MGRIVAPFGVRGWVKVQPYTASPGGLAGYPVWWVGRDGAWRQITVNEAHGHGQNLVAKLEGCDDRDAAAAMKGQEIAVPRTMLPALVDGEYYWTDLIGLRVKNERGEEFGEVESMLATGANEVLVVRGERERLIPFIGEVVKAVDKAAGMIVVDWSADY